ncbi:MAG: hypothetical protein DRM98_02975 [Thermoplasmata archaeon]|nr:MAG: hypothetical protein DRM98_02975 [Thermoplasmata archaeon]
MKKEEAHWFEKSAKIARKYFLWLLKDNDKTRIKLDKYFPKEYVDLLSFSGLDVEPYDILLISYMGAFLTFIGFFIVDILIFLTYGFDIRNIDLFTLFLMFSVTFVFPLIMLNMLAGYPKTYARYMKIHSLGDIPEILSYLVMYLKLVPNLENSVKFAASESSTSLARDLRKMLWDMEIRVYHGIDDALTSFATMWGKWSEYFKRALHLIRSAIQERDEASRIVTLNRALDVALDGTRDMMNKFVNRLHQPAMVIYSIGIMIPLALVAMLPAAGLVGMRVTIFQVFFLYDIILPMFVFIYTRKILLSRPAAFNPPVIPIDHPKLRSIHKKTRLGVALSIGILIASPGVFFLILPFILDDGSSNPLLDFIVNPNGLNMYFPVTLFIIWGVAATVTSYTLSVYHPYKKIRDEIKQMENEFSDALYILGKRISEEKSPEESFMYAAETMEGSKIAEVFSQTGYNLTALHTNLKDAMFNPDYGSLKNVYSDRIKAIMRLFVEGIQKSQRAVSISIIRIADHLKELQAVEKKIKDTLFSLTSTLRSTVAVFAPLIGGITLAITKLISNILNSLSGKISTGAIPSTMSVPGATTRVFTLENIRPEYFVLVIGVYIIELVFLLVRFANGIDEGDDKATYMYSLGKTMPTSIMVFSITVILGQILFSSIVKT